VFPFRVNPAASQMLGCVRLCGRACAFIFHSRRFREGIIGKGGKMSGVGGISRARLSGGFSAPSCVPVALCFARVRQQHVAAFIFLCRLSPAGDAPRDTQDGWFRVVYLYFCARARARISSPSCPCAWSDLRFSHGKARPTCAREKTLRERAGGEIN
jgi:hypothetical protein